jgi:hypothetical protein
MFFRRFYCLAIFAGVSMLVAPAEAKSKKPKAAPEGPKDQIEVVGRIPLTGGPVRRFLTTRHYSSYYLYAEREAGKNVTLIDVSDTERPAVLADVAYPPADGSGSLSLVAGTAALISSEQETSAASPEVSPAGLQTIRIMDFSDPKNPKVAREFSGVTAVSRDDSRGLVFVANGEGIWILHRHLADDPAVDKAYADYVLYNR